MRTLIFSFSNSVLSYLPSTLVRLSSVSAEEGFHGLSSLSTESFRLPLLPSLRTWLKARRPSTEWGFDGVISTIRSSTACEPPTSSRAVATPWGGKGSRLLGNSLDWRIYQDLPLDALKCMQPCILFHDYLFVSHPRPSAEIISMGFLESCGINAASNQRCFTRRFSHGGVVRHQFLRLFLRARKRRQQLSSTSKNSIDFEE